MKLGTVYICTQNMSQSLKFYRLFFAEDPIIVNGNRWVTFSKGISLYNRDYDLALIQEKKSDFFNQWYIENLLIDEGPFQNNMVVFNFEVEDLWAEYQRLQRLAIGLLSEIYMVNVHRPYYYFNLFDPDGNTLEITGPFQPAPTN